MKNLKNILSFRNLDFAAIQIFLSIIAISFAGIVSDASPSVTKLDFHKAILPTVGSGRHMLLTNFFNIFEA